MPSITTPMPDGPGFPREPPSTYAVRADIRSLLLFPQNALPGSVQSSAKAGSREIYCSGHRLCKKLWKNPKLEFLGSNHWLQAVLRFTEFTAVDFRCTKKRR